MDEFISEVGKRLRRSREARRLTLKNVELRSGLSATHISEIERGRTAPTIGALARLARALDRPLGVFLEPEALAETSFVGSGDRVRASLPGGAGWSEQLTMGVACGSMLVEQAQIVSGARWTVRAGTARETLTLAVREGRVRVAVGNELFDIEAPETLHALPGEGIDVLNPGGGLSTLIVIRGSEDVFGS